jgi:hypothetical protein
MSMGMVSLMNARNDYYAMWDIGWHDFSFDHPHYEIDLAWRRYFDPNFSTVLGARLTNHHDEVDRAFGGVEYRLPYLIDSFAQVDSEGEFRFGLGKSLQLTDRLSIFGGVDYDTGSEWEWSAGAQYLLTKQFSLISEFHSDHGFGSMGKVVTKVYDGQEIKFCCKPCVAKFEKNPTKYLAKLP